VDLIGKHNQLILASYQSDIHTEFLQFIFRHLKIFTHPEFERKTINILMVGNKGYGKSTYINTIMSSLSDEEHKVTKTCAPYGDHCTLETVTYPLQFKYNGSIISVPVLSFTDIWGFDHWEDDVIDCALKGQIPSATKKGQKFNPKAELSPPTVIFLLIAIDQFNEQFIKPMKYLIKKNQAKMILR